jgi:hypothetical protein
MEVVVGVTSPFIDARFDLVDRYSAVAAELVYWPTVNRAVFSFYLRGFR